MGNDLRFKVEHDTYPHIEELFRKRGFEVQRIEGNTSVPDMFTYKEHNWFWVEVKMYRGEKSFIELNANDLKWKPGQLRFRNDMIKKGSRKHYLLIVCKEDQFHFYYGGLDRC